MGICLVCGRDTWIMKKESGEIDKIGVCLGCCQNCGTHDVFRGNTSNGFVYRCNSCGQEWTWEPPPIGRYLITIQGQQADQVT